LAEKLKRTAKLSIQILIPIVKREGKEGLQKNVAGIVVNRMVEILNEYFGAVFTSEVYKQPS